MFLFVFAFGMLTRNTDCVDLFDNCSWLSRMEQASLQVSMGRYALKVSWVSLDIYKRILSTLLKNSHKTSHGGICSLSFCQSFCVSANLPDSGKTLSGTPVILLSVLLNSSRRVYWTLISQDDPKGRGLECLTSLCLLNECEWMEQIA